MLFEMAIALIVVGVITLTVYPALTTMRISSQRSTTEANLQALMRATASYVQTNGCVPCPTNPMSVGNSFGKVGSTINATPSSCGTCATSEGIVPYVSLGVTSATAHDGWGHWISMRVDPALTANYNYNPANPGVIPANVVPPTKPVACGCSSPVSGSCAATPANSACSCSTPLNNVCTPLPTSVSQQGLCTANLSASAGAIPVNVYGPGTSMPQKVAVLFISYGVNGYGSFAASSVLNGVNGARLPFPGTSPACTSPAACAGNSNMSVYSCYASCNRDGNNHFIDAPPADSYDDILAYADRNTLVSMLGNGACQTVW